MRQGSDTPIADKVRYVKNASQDRDHECHWPDCTEQVPPAKWGCLRHWRMLPHELQEKIWRAFRPGQEVDGRPSAAYIEVAREVQAWIASRPTGSGWNPRRPDNPKDSVGDFSKPSGPGKSPAVSPMSSVPNAPAKTSGPKSPPALSSEVQSALHQLALHFADRPAAVIPLFEEVKEEFSERSAIREHLGGLDRWQAEQHAYTDTVEVMNDRHVKKHVQTTLPVG